MLKNIFIKENIMIKHIMKEGLRWDTENKRWIIPNEADSIKHLMRLFNDEVIGWDKLGITVIYFDKLQNFDTREVEKQLDL